MACLVMSPGAYAYAYAELGRQVPFYGKPHRRIFDALSPKLGARRILMVGDSLEHDIVGAQAVGWDSLLVQGGLYAAEFAQADHDLVLAKLVALQGCTPSTYSIKLLPC
jgi:ribonucleotide monophosphatase NagD (HAD superfamily)